MSVFFYFDFFFFMQRTAYEVRISDWSSDVCSSDLDELKASVAALKTQVDAQAVAASRLPLDGAKAAADPARDAFVERYLRRGIDAGVEMKSLSGARDRKSTRLNSSH